MASRSTRSFIGSPEWPFTHSKVTGRPDVQGQGEQRLPQVPVGHRLALGVAPAPALPPLPPRLPEAVDDVGRVAHHVQRAGQGLEGPDHRGDLHPLVGGVGLAAAVRAARRPPPRPSRPVRGCPGRSRRCRRRSAAGSGSVGVVRPSGQHARSPAPRSRAGRDAPIGMPVTRPVAVPIDHRSMIPAPRGGSMGACCSTVSATSFPTSIPSETAGVARRLRRRRRRPRPDPGPLPPDAAPRAGRPEAGRLPGHRLHALRQHHPLRRGARVPRATSTSSGGSGPSSGGTPR